MPTEGYGQAANPWIQSRVPPEPMASMTEVPSGGIRKLGEMSRW